jgi:hypothetical protein
MPVDFSNRASLFAPREMPLEIEVVSDIDNP